MTAARERLVIDEPIRMADLVALEESTVDVSVVIPCLNEEMSITSCVQEALDALARMGVTGEVLVVDNGSTDESARLAREAGARVIFEPRRGYGNACRRGLISARGRFLVLGDGDGTYPFSALPAFVEPLYNGCDMVVGSRLHNRSEKGAMPWLHRYVGNPMLTMILNALFGVSVSDVNCGLRSIKRDNYRQLGLMSEGMEFITEWLIEASKTEVRITEVDIIYRHRVGGEPKLRTFRDGWRNLRLMLTRAAKHRTQWHKIAALHPNDR